MKLNVLLDDYNKDPTEKNAERLCKRIRLLTRVVLRDFNLKYLPYSYEDLLQQSYLFFFEQIQSCENVKSLDGFFIVSLRNHLFKQIFNHQQLTKCGELADFDSNVLDVMIREEDAEKFRREMNALLQNDAEHYILKEYILEGETNYRKIVSAGRKEINKIAKRIKDKRTTQQIVMDTLLKIRTFLEKKYPQLKLPEVVND